MTALDDVRVEIAFSTDPNTLTPAFVDMTSRARLDAGISIARGRQDEFSDVQAGTCTLTLDNNDGALTPGYVARPLRTNYATNPRLAFVGAVLLTEWGTGTEWIDDQFDSVAGRALAADTAVTLIDGGTASSTYTLTLDGGHA